MIYQFGAHWYIYVVKLFIRLTFYYFLKKLDHRWEQYLRTVGNASDVDDAATVVAKHRAPVNQAGGTPTILFVIAVTNSETR